METWVDDDTASKINGTTYGIESVKDIADTLGIKCTFGCITNAFENEHVKNRLLDYQKHGFHITTHSHTHNPDFWYTDTVIPDAEEDLITSLQLLQSNGFLNSDCLIIPGGNGNPDLLKMIAKHCQCSVLADSNKGRNHYYQNGRYKICRVFIRDTFTVDEYKVMIDTAYENGDWIIFGTHSGIDGQWNTDKITEVLQYAIAKGFEFHTLYEAYKIRKPNSLG